MKILKIFIILFLVTSFSELKSDEINDFLKNKILKNIIRCEIKYPPPSNPQNMHNQELSTLCVP